MPCRLLRKTFGDLWYLEVLIIEIKMSALLFFLIVCVFSIFIILSRLVQEKDRQGLAQNQPLDEEQLKYLRDNARRWERKVIELVEKHKAALAKERKKLLSKYAYGNIVDKGWNGMPGRARTKKGIPYFIDNVIETAFDQPGLDRRRDLGLPPWCEKIWASYSRYSTAVYPYLEEYRWGYACLYYISRLEDSRPIGSYAFDWVANKINEKCDEVDRDGYST
jgi:hypothetical protein